MVNHNEQYYLSLVNYVWDLIMETCISRTPLPKIFKHVDIDKLYPEAIAPDFNYSISGDILRYTNFVLLGGCLSYNEYKYILQPAHMSTIYYCSPWGWQLRIDLSRCRTYQGAHIPNCIEIDSASHIHYEEVKFISMKSDLLQVGVEI